MARLGPLADEIRRRFGMTTEVVVNDNCSTDNTAEELRVYADHHDRSRFILRVFRFSRDIGFQKSILVGYRKARGAAVAQIDADLQDPPEVLLDFIDKWRDGHQVVYGVRQHRAEGFLIRAARRQFYRLLDRLSEGGIPRDAGDFRLLDRSVVDIVCAMHDNDPYLRGAIAALGLKQVGIPYDRVARATGRSKFGLRQLIKLALDGITNHTTLPLMVSSYLASGVLLLTIALITYYSVAWLLGAVPLPLGFMTQVLLQLVTLAALAFLFAIHGFYIQRIYNQLKERPLAIIERESGATEEDNSPRHARFQVLWIGRSETGEDLRSSPPADRDANVGGEP